MFITWREYKGNKGITYRCHLRETKKQSGKAKTKTVGYLGSIADKPNKPQRELFWMQVKTSLDRTEISIAERAKIEAAIAAKVPRGINSHGDSDAPTEWYTPPEYVDKARRVLGEIDLDPASNALAQKWIQAGNYFTQEDNGLIQPWQGRVWCNPPYGRQVRKWLEKALASYEAKEMKSAIMLLNRSEADWYKESLQKIDAICEVKKRIAFLNASGQKQPSPRYHNDFLYIGRNVEKFKQEFESLGELRTRQ